MQNNKLPKMRLLNEAYAEIKKLDPDTAVTKYYIRQLMLSGKVRCVTAGRKRLVDLDSLIEYLSNSQKTAALSKESEAAALSDGSEVAALSDGSEAAALSNESGAV